MAELRFALRAAREGVQGFSGAQALLLLAFGSSGLRVPRLAFQGRPGPFDFPQIPDIPWRPELVQRASGTRYRT